MTVPNDVVCFAILGYVDGEGGHIRGNVVIW